MISKSLCDMMCGLLSGGDQSLSLGKYKQGSSDLLLIYPISAVLSNVEPLNLGELEGGGYSRASLTDVLIYSDVDGVNVVTNDSDIEFPKATEDLGEVTHWCIVDETNKSAAFYGELVTPIKWIKGTKVVVPAGDLQIIVPFS